MSTALKNDSPTHTLQPVTARLPALHPKAVGATRLFFNRELSLLEFHRRVLEEGLDASNPLLERLKFLGIFSSNIDEFFMIRVAGVKRKLDAGIGEPGPDGRTPTAALAAIRRTTQELLDEHADLLGRDLLPALAAAPRSFSVSPRWKLRVRSSPSSRAAWWNRPGLGFLRGWSGLE